MLSWYYIQLCVIGIRFKCAGFGIAFKKVGWVSDSNVCLSNIFNCACLAPDLNQLALVQHSKRLTGYQIQMCCLSIILNCVCSALYLNVLIWYSIQKGWLSIKCVVMVSYSNELTQCNLRTRFKCAGSVQQLNSSS